MDTSKLPDSTRQLWERLQHEPMLSGFVLIGGTALTLRIGHRISEDLDFAYLGELLPVQRIQLLVRMLNQEGYAWRMNQDIAAEQDFINSGLVLEEHQQNYVVATRNGNVKVSLVRFDNAITSRLSGSATAPIRLATLDEAFKTKTLVCAERSRTRDWFDLYVLMTRHGYDAADFHRTFTESGSKNHFDIATMRLRSCIPAKTDEGYVHLLETAPTLEQMREFFNRIFDQLEIDLSASAFRTPRNTTA